MTAKFPQAATATRSPHYARQVTVHYTAEAAWYRPPLDTNWPMGSVEAHFTCKHKHKTPEQAIACGERGAAKAARSWQRFAEQTFPKRPCRIGVYRDKDCYQPEGWEGSGGSGYTEPGFLVYCAAHGTNGATLHRTEAQAQAQGWECPWAPFVVAERDMAGVS